MNGTPHVHDVTFSLYRGYDVERYGAWYLTYGDTEIEVFSSREHFTAEMIAEEPYRQRLLEARNKAVLKHDAGSKAALLAAQKAVAAMALLNRVVAELQPPPVKDVWWSDTAEDSVSEPEVQRQVTGGLWNHKVVKFVTIR